MKQLDEERIHMENLVNNRFNYLMVILAIIIAGILNSKSPSQARILFIFGSTISIGLTWTILRAQKRFDVLIDKIHEDQSHAATYSKAKADESCIFNPAKYSARKIIGYVFPISIVLFMLFGSFKPDMMFFDNKIDYTASDLKSQHEIINDRLSKIELFLENSKKNSSKKTKVSDEQI